MKPETRERLAGGEQRGSCCREVTAVMATREPEEKENGFLKKEKTHQSRISPPVKISFRKKLK